MKQAHAPLLLLVLYVLVTLKPEVYVQAMAIAMAPSTIIVTLKIQVSTVDDTLISK